MHVPLAIKSRFTPGVAVALSHYLAWRLAVFAIRFDHDIEGIGAHFFFGVVIIRWYVVAGVCIYSVLRRFVLRQREWDIYGPPLATLSAVLMYLEIQPYLN
jgi:hypothetical protein